MHIKWKMFMLTFVTYSVIHSVRTAWSSLKYILNDHPYNFSPIFLGTLDLIVLFTLAISLNLLGPKIQTFGLKKFLIQGIVLLFGVVCFLALLLLRNVEMRWPYVIFYILVGFASCVGWPSCMFILSKFMEKGMAFSLWNGCSQFGDFLALITSFVLIETMDANGGILMITIAAYLILIGLLNYFCLPEHFREQEKDQHLEEFPPEKKSEELVQEHQIKSEIDEKVKQDSQIKSEINQKIKQQAADQKGVKKMESIDQSAGEMEGNINFLSVWLLPGVAGYLLSYSLVKSVNAIIVTWLVFYLSMIDLNRESRIIAILWSLSTFAGGVIGSYINPHFNRKIFVAALLACSIMFVFLEELHIYPNEAGMFVLIICCGLTYGGPYTLMGTSIPLLLSEKPEIKSRVGAKAAIISAMEGYGLLFCGFALLITPAIGVIDMHWVACFYCFLPAIILIVEIVREDRATAHSAQQQLEQIKQEAKSRKHIQIKSERVYTKEVFHQVNQKLNRSLDSEKINQLYSNKNQDQRVLNLEVVNFFSEEIQKSEISQKQTHLEVQSDSILNSESKDVDRQKLHQNNQDQKDTVQWQMASDTKDHTIKVDEVMQFAEKLVEKQNGINQQICQEYQMKELVERKSSSMVQNLMEKDDEEMNEISFEIS